APYDKAMRTDVKKVTVRRVRQVLRNKTQPPPVPEHLTKE
nr:non-structural protein 3B (VPg) [limnipivirus B1]